MWPDTITATTQSPRVESNYPLAAAQAQQAMMSNLLEAHRSMVWVMDEHLAALLRHTSAQLQNAYRDVAAAVARAAIAEARATAAENRAARAEAVVALLKQELGRS